MKECPKCHKLYDDNVNFCVLDGCRLLEHVSERDDAAASSSSSNNGTENGKNDVPSGAPRPVKKKGKRGCLKKIVVSIIVLLVAFGLFYNYIMNAASYLRVEPDTVIAPKAGVERKIDIDYDGYVWIINHKPDWVSVVENDDDFVLKVSPNMDGQVREGSITVQSGKLLAQLVIRQSAYASYMRASESSLGFGKGGGSKSVELRSDGCSWEARSPGWIIVSDDTPGWMKGAGGTCRLTVKCSRNTGEYRSGSVVVNEDDVSTVIYVTQAGKCDICHGEGKVTCIYCGGIGGYGYGMFYSNCIWCGGKGSYECSTCGGTGYRE